MRRWVLCATLALSACKPATPAAPAAPANAPLRNDEERTLYALGLAEGRRLEVFSLTPAELAIVQRGMRDQTTGAHPLVSLDEFGPRINTMARARNDRPNPAREAARAAEQAAAQAALGPEHTAGAAFADTAAHEAGAERLPSGLVFRTIREGTGAHPTAESTVRVHYRGTLRDGTEFDSSYTRGEPVEFPLGGVVPCWTEGVQRIAVGGKARLVCPPAIAYGDRATGRIPAGATLNFEVELIAIVSGPGASDAGAAPTTAPAAARPGARPALNVPTGQH